MSDYWEDILNSSSAVPRMRGYRTAMSGGVNKNSSPNGSFFSLLRRTNQE